MSTPITVNRTYVDESVNPRRLLPKREKVASKELNETSERNDTASSPATPGMLRTRGLGRFSGALVTAASTARLDSTGCVSGRRRSATTALTAATAAATKKGSRGLTS